MCRFGVRTDNGRSVVVDVFITGPDSCAIGERLAVAGGVYGFWTNKANQVVERSRFVLRDLKEERSNGLSKSRDDGVKRLSFNQLEVIEGVGEF